ncbi:MAG: 4Fe-4S binding protein, partial [Deltaproteobacteria bacterium]|nr:4Fe-4S binding protein [Deltaproteobacteria bacterium]
MSVGWRSLSLTVLAVHVLLGPSSARAEGAELRLEGGNLSCLPHDCSIPLEDGQVLRRYANSVYPVYEFVDGDEVLGFYFLSSDVVEILAYSGKPIYILVGMNPEGIIQEARLIAHSEPILLVGISEQRLVDFIEFYEGKNIRNKINVGEPLEGYLNVDMITGATVTALVADQTIMTAARLVAIDQGMLAKGTLTRNSITDEFVPMSWSELVESGAVGRLTIRYEDMDLPAVGEPWLDLYFADLTQPSIGRNLLGDRSYDWLMGIVKPDESALMIAGQGSWSFKGSGFVRGGIYDRFHVEQGLSSFAFKDLDYENLYSIDAEGAPHFKERGIFILRDAAYDRTEPWEMVVLASRLTGETANSKIFETFRGEYQLPKRFIVRNLSLVAKVWQDKKYMIAVYLLLWWFVIHCFTFRKKLASNLHALEWAHNTTLVLSVVLLGLYLRAQPSVVNFFAIFGIALRKGSWEPFLVDPYLALGWVLIAATTLIWGRSLFCGWLCPYGAMQELLIKLRIRLTPFKKSLEFPPKLRATLKPLRYVIFLLLFSISLFSIETAELLAEVEPFKTTWNIGVLNRSSPFVVYWFALFLAALVMERFFCRYLCPLGAALALFSRFPIKPIPRRKFCSKCKICNRGCAPHAIDDQGRINPAECLGCFECINSMRD